ncbi:hypothetical protein [Bradyrhizobium sp. 170]|uniref:hypothetical protein n=1 Tax=Bradyrhizobium sp. 170 TaxID=2782641 RepID=UPI0020005211|nr:hypothetical protein [Bradyrhizobium sp. 170]UPK03155.1 hypothetical protein IVB05_37370 [Bradyrhizobium sp. 170]
MAERTHELKIYANAHHRTAQHGELILHLWFCGGGHTLALDLEIARQRPDVAYVDLIDCVKHTTERLYPLQGGDDAKRERGKGRKRPARRNHG